jgi:hypothetical protein
MRRLVCRDRESVREEERAAVRQNLLERVRHASHFLLSLRGEHCRALVQHRPSAPRVGDSRRSHLESGLPSRNSATEIAWSGSV